MGWKGPRTPEYREKRRAAHDWLADDQKALIVEELKKSPRRTLSAIAQDWLVSTTTISNIAKAAGIDVIATRKKKGGFTPAETNIAKLLLTRTLVSSDSVKVASGSHSKDTAKVILHNLRTKLEQHKIEIINIHGEGWKIDTEQKPLLRSLLELEHA